MKDPSSKSITVSVKVSRAEAETLRALAKESSRPTPGKGLRWLIDKYLGRTP